MMGCTPDAVTVVDAPAPDSVPARRGHRPLHRPQQAAWDRLDELTSRAGRRLRKLTPAEVDELVRLYQRVSSHLSHARTAYHDPALTGRLTRLVSGPTASSTAPGPGPAAPSATSSPGGSPPPSTRAGGSSPPARRSCSSPPWPWACGSAPATPPSTPRPRGRARGATSRRTSRTTTRPQPAADFASQVTVNNIQVSLLAFAGGILLCLPTGCPAGAQRCQPRRGRRAVRRRRRAARSSSGLILPHGLLELPP